MLSDAEILDIESVIAGIRADNGEHRSEEWWVKKMAAALDNRERQGAKLGREMMELSALKPWPQLRGGDKAVLIGRVGVDSASVQIGDFVSGCGGRMIYTPEGDGAYVLYAKLINGRRCLVIDFDASTDGEHVYESDKRTRGEWKCPQCGASKAHGSYWADGEEFTCANDHTTEYEHKEITNQFRKLEA